MQVACSDGGRDRSGCRRTIASALLGRGALRARCGIRGGERRCALRFDPSSQQIHESTKIAFKSSSPVDERFWTRSACKIACNISEHMGHDLAKAHRALAKHIGWVDDLRVTESISRDTTALDAEVYAACIGALDEPAAAFSESPCEI